MHKQKLYCKKSKWRARGSYVLGNGLLRLTTLPGGGHVAEIRFEKTSGHSTMNPLWVPPWRTMDAHKYRPNRDSKDYGSITEGKLLSGITGHNICLDYFGSPSPEEARLGLSQHGEAPSSQWKIDAHSINASNVGIKLKVRLPTAGLQFSRTMTLCRNESVVYFQETISNERKADHFFDWTQHVTLGRPFLGSGAASVALSGSKGLTSPQGYDEDKTMLAPGKTFRWPIAPRATPGTADLTQPFSHAGLGYVAAVLVNPSRTMGFIAAINPTERLLFGYCFLRSDFPWITLWEENRALEAVPWKRQTQALGLEFGTTPIPAGRRDKFLNGGPLFGIPTTTFIPARGKKSVRYLAFLASLPPEFVRLRDIKTGNNELLLFREGSRTPARLAASKIAELIYGS